VNKSKPIFADVLGTNMWIEGLSMYKDSNILVTLTSANSKNSVLVSQHEVNTISTTQLVDTPDVVENAPKTSKFRTLGKFTSVAGYIGAIILLAFSALSFSGSVKARIVLTGSMEPAISAGDVIITTPITRKAPQIDDVIAYQAKRFNGENVAVFSHRIIDGDIENGFIVKGDANKSPDPQKPKAEDILGVVFFVIPFIGNLLTPKALFLLLPCAFGLWLIMDAMKNVE
jgi:signal peptidase